jgi:hypothetical protein
MGDRKIFVDQWAAQRAEIASEMESIATALRVGAA